MLRYPLALAVLFFPPSLVGCDESMNLEVDAASRADVTARDASVPRSDATVEDATSPDVSTVDAEAFDAVAPDALAPDADPVDGGVDLGLPDADPADADSADADSADADWADADPPETGELDADPADIGPGTCTVSPNSCTNGEICVGTSCGCIQALHGNHYLRTDGTVVNWAGTPTVITVAGGAPLPEITEIYSGSAHGCALRGDGTVWCWPLSSLGDSSGQLGDGVINASLAAPTFNIATQVFNAAGLPLTQVEHISGGSSRGYAASNTCAILQDGSLWCWGSPDSSGGGGGTLFNDGLPGNRPFAVQILAAAATPLTGVQAVSLGLRHACLIRNGASTGEVWCWAANIGGSLGQGDENGRQYPTQVTLPGPADQVGAGADATCARVGDAVYCWGSNNSGQVGIGAPNAPGNHDGCINYCKLTPARALDFNNAPLANVVNLSVGYLANCAKRNDHSVWCWGSRDGNPDNLAVQAVINSKVLDDVALLSSSGTGGYAQSLLYLERDAELFRVAAPATPLCP